jgi:preprotein translocase subunit SecD
VDKDTLIVLGVIGAFVALFVALFIARVLLGYVLERQKTTRRGY